MSRQHPGPAGRPGAPRPDGSQQPGTGQWEDEWEGYDGARRGVPPPPHRAAHPGAPWPPPPGSQANPPHSRIQPVTAGVIAVIAALAVAIVVLLTVNGHSTTPSPAAGTGNAPAGGGAPAQGGAGGGPVGGGGRGGAGGGSGSHLFLGGQVIKASSASITLSAQGRDITAAITSSTQFTGTVKTASGIKPGQRVIVIISGYGTAHPIAQQISDPPSMP